MSSEEEKIKSQKSSKTSSGSGLFLNPQNVVEQLRILPGMSIANFGCGTGVFTFPVAMKVGERGTVWALDILEYKIELVRSQAKKMGLGNVVVKKVNLEGQNGSGLEDDSVDWVLIVNMLYQNEKKNRIIREAKRIIKAKGKILFIDWKPSLGMFGPDIKNRISHEDRIKLVKKNGLGIAKELEIGNFYFGMILTK